MPQGAGFGGSKREGGNPNGPSGGKGGGARGGSIGPHGGRSQGGVGSATPGGLGFGGYGGGGGGRNAGRTSVTASALTKIARNFYNMSPQQQKQMARTGRLSDALSRAGVRNNGQIDPATGNPIHTNDWGISVSRTPQAQTNLMDAYKDYKNIGNTFGEDLGNFLGGSLGFNETNPATDPNFNAANQSQANWGWDPVQGLATGVGLATGIPLGSFYRGLTYLAGHPVNINMGPSVFGAPSEPSTTTGSAVKALSSAAQPSGAASTVPQTLASDAPNNTFVGPMSTVATRSPFNNRIGGFGAGGWAGAGSSYKSRAKNPLAQALMAPKF